MKAIRLLVLLIPLLLLTACHSGQRREMLALLDEADSLNRAYAQLPADSLLRRAADFFDRHGSRNEQVRAHYLLGCAYRDQGQAPEALQAYQDAIDRADTTSTDSTHNALLCRVYSQMGDLYYRQVLIDDYLTSLERSITFAMKSGDTIAAINSYLFRATAFARRGMADSVIAICDSAYKAYSKLGYTQRAARNVLIGLPSYLSKKQFTIAEFYLSAYEQKSGFFDEFGDIEKGREAFYGLKGMFFLDTGKLDSAEFYFRKELSEGHDLNNQNEGSYGLAQTFLQRGQTDSAAKYSIYAYTMNDSAYQRMSTQEVERIQRLYDYTTFQNQVLQEHERVNVLRLRLILLGIVLVILLISAVTIIRLINKERERKKKEYEKSLNQLSIIQTELMRLRDTDEELCGLIAEKENIAEQLFTVISHARGVRRKNINSLKESPAYNNLHKKAIVGKPLSSDEWDELNMQIINYLPNFYEFITAPQNALTIKEYQLCVLLRLQVRPIDISHIFGVDPSYVTKLAKNVLHKLFDCDGTTRELVSKLDKMN